MLKACLKIVSITSITKAWFKLGASGYNGVKELGFYNFDYKGLVQTYNFMLKACLKIVSITSITKAWFKLGASGYNGVKELGFYNFDYKGLVQTLTILKQSKHQFL